MYQNILVISLQGNGIYNIDDINFKNLELKFIKINSQKSHNFLNIIIFYFLYKFNYYHRIFINNLKYSSNILKLLIFKILNKYPNILKNYLKSKSNIYTISIQYTFLEGTRRVSWSFKYNDNIISWLFW